MLQRFASRRWLISGFVAAVVTLWGMGGLISSRLTAMISTEKWVVHTREVLSTIEGLRSAVERAEGAWRGYALAGREQERRECETAVAGIRPAFEQLRTITAGYVDQQRDLDELYPVLEKEIAWLTAAVQGPGKASDGAREAAWIDAGSELRQQIDHGLDHLNREEAALLAHRKEASENSIRQARLGLVMAGGLSTLLLLLVFGILLRQMRESEKAAAELGLTHQALEHALEGVSVVDTRGTYRRVNRAYAAALDCLPGELLGRPWLSAIHADDQMTVLEAHRRMLLEGDAECEVRFIKRDKSTFFALFQLVRPPDPVPEGIGHYGFVRDITERKVAEEQLQRSEEQFRVLSTASPIGIFMGDEEGRLVYTNAQWRSISGLSSEEAKAYGWSRIIHPDDRDAVLGQWREAARAGREYSAEFRILTTQGAERWVRVQAAAVQRTETRTDYVGTSEDITDRRLSTAAIEDAKSQLEVKVGELESRAREMRILGEMAEKLQALLTPEEAYEVIGHFSRQLFPDVAGSFDLINSSRNLVEATIQWGAASPGESCYPPHHCWALRSGKVHRMRGRDADLVCRHFGESPPGGSVCIPMSAQGELIGVLHLQCNHPEDCLGTDTDHLRLAATLAEQVSLAMANLKLRDALRNQAIRDPLTGLFNRRYMEESLDRELMRAERQGCTVGAIMLDIDFFKKFNDSYGHEMGDELLREVGLFLRKQVRGEDIVCRYGGEEFTILMPDANLDQTRMRAEKIRGGVKELQIRHLGQLVGPVTLSLGVAAYPENGTNGQALVSMADAALYRAKKAGRDQVQTAPPVQERAA